WMGSAAAPRTPAAVATTLDTSGVTARTIEDPPWVGDYFGRDSTTALSRRAGARLQHRRSAPPSAARRGALGDARHRRGGWSFARRRVAGDRTAASRLP